MGNTTYLELVWNPSKKALEKAQKIEKKLKEFNTPIGRMTYGKATMFLLARAWFEYRAFVYTVGATAVITGAGITYVALKAGWGA